MIWWARGPPVDCITQFPARCPPQPGLPHRITPVSRCLRTDLGPGARPGAFITVCAARHSSSGTRPGQLPGPTISPLCDRRPA